jgi:hypothetical protein
MFVELSDVTVYVKKGWEPKLPTLLSIAEFIVEFTGKLSLLKPLPTQL